MSLLERQLTVTPQRGMPVNDVMDTSEIISVTGQTVQLYYISSGVVTADAGEAAGTAVFGYLPHNNIMNSGGKMTATSSDTSLSFTSTALTTERGLSEAFMEDGDARSPGDRLTLATQGFSNGNYAVDYINGIVYGLKTSTTTSLTAAAYKVNQKITGGSSTIATSVDVAKWGGTATTIGQKAMTASVPVVLASDQSSVSVNTELPAAAALADNAATPTAPAVGSFGMVYDGSTWDMARGDATNGTLVNLGTNNDVTVTGTVTADTELPAAAAITDGLASATTPQIAADLMLLNSAGSTWDRAKSGITTPTATLTGFQNTLPMGEYNSSEPTLTNGQVDNIQLNAKGHTKTAEQYAPTAEDNTSWTYYVTNRPVATAADPNSHANIMTVVNSTALEASHILKAAAGRFYYARVEIDSTATTGTYYVQLINSATLPADGAVTLLIAPIKVHHTNGITSAVDIDRSMYGVYASAGIVVTVSSTQYTKTIITSNWMNAEGHVA